MRRLLALAAPCSLLLVLASSANAGSLLGVTYWDGELWSVDPHTGATSQLGSTHKELLNSLTFHAGLIYSVSNDTGELFSINPFTGAVVETASLDFGALGVDVRALAFSPNGRLFAVNRWHQMTLHEIDLATGEGALVGTLAHSGFQALEFSPSGILYGWDFASGLVSVDPSSAVVTAIDPTVAGDGMQSLAFDEDGSLYGIVHGGSHGRPTGLEIYMIDVTTGVPTLSASTGWGGTVLRGIAFIPEPSTATLLCFGIAFLSLTRRLTSR